MRSSLDVSIRAPADLVFHLVKDVERWPELLPHYVSVGVRERHGDGSVTARMVARRSILPVLGLGLPVAWRSRTWNEPGERRLRFVHRGGATNGMDVTWRIVPADAGCTVTIEHVFAPRFAPWASLIERLFVRPIAGRTLATFKSIAEAVAEHEGARDSAVDGAAARKAAGGAARKASARKTAAQETAARQAADVAADGTGVTAT